MVPILNNAKRLYNKSQDHKKNQKQRISVMKEQINNNNNNKKNQFMLVSKNTMKMQEKCLLLLNMEYNICKRKYYIILINYDDNEFVIKYIS